MIEDFINNFITLINAMSFFILIGVIIAGVLKQLIPSDFISSHLGTNSTSSVIKATLFGIPMPVCSCSVIPLAKSLQKEGASKGAVQSFLISTPITGVDSIAATYSFFGIFFTLYRVITSIFMAIITGLLQNKFDTQEIVKPKPKFQTLGKISLAPTKSCCSTPTPTKKSFSLKAVFSYAFGTLFKDMAGSLLFGLILGTAFTTLLPKELLEEVFAYQFLTYLAVLLIALPLYVCATASLPIAGAFILSGMSGGAAFIFLSAGPATNSVTMGIVKEMFGTKSLAIYLGSIASMSILFGYLFDLYTNKLTLLNMSEHMSKSSLVDTISSFIMIGLILYYLFRARSNRA